MAIKKISIQQFLALAEDYPVLDVRSPGEHNHACIPGAHSLPLFTDEERKIVGTAYKKEGKQVAVKLGLDFFGVRMKVMIEQAEEIVKHHEIKSERIEINGAARGRSNTVLLNCWRGGMRSAGVAWLLDLYGFDVYTLVGGYKAYRNWVLQQFENDYNLVIVGGFTGSGKTGLLEQLQKMKYATVDLEALANHKGSAFGEMGKQPTQEMFENLLSQQLYLHEASGKTIWLEDESQRIGQINIPHLFWATMRAKPIYFINIPFEKRLDHIVSTYGVKEREKLVNSILRVQKRLGPLEAKTAIGFIIENNYRACFEILLKYYDKAYSKSLLKRDQPGLLITQINCAEVDPIVNTEKMISCATVNV